MAFLNCNSVTDFASSCVWELLIWLIATSSAAYTKLSRQSHILPSSTLRDLFLSLASSVGVSWRAWITKAFQKKVYLGEKTLKELSYFHVHYFLMSSFFFFPCLNSFRPSCPMLNRNLNTFTEHNIADLCLNSHITVEHLFPPILTHGFVSSGMKDDCNTCVDISSLLG